MSKNKVQILDCTLRDGGYVNNWMFGHDTIVKIIEKLVLTRVDYIECGYLTQTMQISNDTALFSSFEELSSVLPNKSDFENIAVMINYGEYPIDSMPEVKDGNGPVIRVAFHKKDWRDAVEYCKELVDKGYRVFVQPMCTLNYLDEEFIALIKKVNSIGAQAFYIVDSFGYMEIEDFKRLLLLADHNLDAGIRIGYHSHNNMQQAYSNAKYFVEEHLHHAIVVDASVYGIGRGAGNLNNELFAQYLNNNYWMNYKVEPMLEIMDEYLYKLYLENPWGYSLPFYFSAVHKCHPNYAGYYSQKKQLNVMAMNELLVSIPMNMKSNYSVEFAEKHYIDYLSRWVDDSEAKAQIKKCLEGKNVLIIAPGKSIIEYKDKIDEYIKLHRPITFLLNFETQLFEYDYVMCTNIKRIGNITCNKNKKILTSNITQDVESGIILNYAALRNENEYVSNDVTLMLLELLTSIGIKRVKVAGLDGYSLNSDENYFEKSMTMGSRNSERLRKNTEMESALCNMSRKISIEMLTPSIYKISDMNK